MRRGRGVAVLPLTRLRGTEVGANAGMRPAPCGPGGPLDTPAAAPDNQPVTAHELPELSVRPSDEERERAIDVLKEGVAQGRLSHETFVRRMELVLRARGSFELRSLTADLPAGRVGTRAARAFGASAAFVRRLHRNLRSSRLPKLLLPPPGPRPLRIGRGDTCDLRIADDCVSRSHAELRADGERWLLRDLGSMNGTWVNDVRVIGEVRVRDGDAVRFGHSGYRLAIR